MVLYSLPFLSDWDGGNSSSGSDSIVKWEEQYLPSELRLQWKKRNGSHFAVH
jgi:hypothetical protein